MPYRGQPNYGYQDYGVPPDYAKYAPVEHGYPNRPYPGKDYPQYDFEGQFERNYPPRKQYPVEMQGYNYGQTPQRPHDGYSGFKGEPQRFNYPPQPQQAYQGYDDGYNPYSSQRGFNQYDAPRGPSGKFPPGNSGYPPEPQNRFKGPALGKNADDLPFYDRSAEERGGPKQPAQKDLGYGKSVKQQGGNRGRKGKKKDSDPPFYQSKQGGQSHNESGY
jgi:hypothetical protein